MKFYGVVRVAGWLVGLVMTVSIESKYSQF